LIFATYSDLPMLVDFIVDHITSQSHDFILPWGIIGVSLSQMLLLWNNMGGVST
jgi:hypothetical protein